MKEKDKEIETSFPELELDLSLEMAAALEQVSDEDPKEAKEDE